MTIRQVAGGRQAATAGEARIRTMVDPRVESRPNPAAPRPDTPWSTAPGRVQ